MSGSCQKSRRFLSPTLRLQQTILSHRGTHGTSGCGELSTRGNGSYSSLLDIPEPGGNDVLAVLNDQSRKAAVRVLPLRWSDRVETVVPQYKY